MSDEALQLLNAFAALPPDERYAVMVELARISETDAGAITEEELARAGDEIFSIYDKEEEQRGNTETR